MAKKKAQPTSVENPTLQAVAYTDGSYRGNTSGYGIHGYLHDGLETKIGTGNPKVVPTCEGYNSAARKIGAPRVKPLKYFEAYGGVEGLQTNNTAEITAALMAMETVLDLIGKGEPITRLSIYTDSEYVVKTATKWLAGYAKNGWKKSTGETIKNLDLWKRFLSVKQSLEEKIGSIKFEWVKGHDGEPGNYRADLLACAGSTRSKRTGEISIVEMEYPGDGFWKKTFEKHPFLAARYAYFKVQNGPDGEPVIDNSTVYLGDNKLEDYQEGKRSTDVSVSVVKFFGDEENPFRDIIKAVEVAQNTACNGVESQFRTDLMELGRNDVSSSIEKFGDLVLVCERPHRFDMSFMGMKTITTEFRPLGISGRTIDVAKNLESILYEAFVTNSEGDPSSETLLRDVTDCFYDLVQIKKKGLVEKVYQLKKEFVVGSATAMVPVDYDSSPNGTPLTSVVKKTTVVPMVFGHDMLDRNAFKRLEDYRPAIFSITWKTSETSFDYAIVMVAGKTIGIWAAPYTNHRLLVG